MNRMVATYIFGSMGLNGMSKMIEVWDAKVKRYDYTQKSASGYVENDMLIGEKLSIITFNVITGPIKLPYTIIDNLNKLDILMKNENPEAYGYRKVKYVYDYY